MNTKLSFAGPEDLSVGTVRISGETGVIKEWIATPNNRKFNDDASPGFYIAEIAPAGVRSQSVIFEVKPGIENNVSVPDFSSLAVSGDSTTFLNVSDPNAAVEALSRGWRETQPESWPASEERAPRIVLNAVRLARTQKRITIALAAEASPGEESWRPYQGPTEVTLTSNSLTALVKDQEESLINEAPPRLRLSLAVEDVRVERLLLPRYRGGTYIVLSPSQLSTLDVELEVMPADPERRALFRALVAGAQEEAIEVRDRVLNRSGAWRFLQGPDADPWAAILASLLTFRFPDVFGRIDQERVGALLSQAPWASDAHVINARTLLTIAGTDAQARRTAAACALTALAKAQALGSPYFSYSNQLIGEMLTALGSLQQIEEEVVQSSLSLLAKWQRNLPLECASRATFKWRRRDRRKLAKGEVAPDGNSSGVLSRRYGAILFRGTIETGRICLETIPRIPPKATNHRVFSDKASGLGKRQSPSIPWDSPALSRPPGPPADPNKGRFGGKAESDGFSLVARFDQTKSEHFVRLTLSVEAMCNAPMVNGDPVMFCLHPTFNPQWVRTIFRGQHASILLKTWGGFTVGVWLPQLKVELECDLSQLKDAPKVVRDL